MCVGLLMIFGNYKNLEISELLYGIGWVFLLGGEVYLGINIIEYSYNKSKQGGIKV